MTARSEALCAFAAAQGADPSSLRPASADASFRSYWRVQRGGESLIVMDSPPELEPVQPWLDLGRRLAAAGLHVPAVYAADLDQGLLLIEDFGTRTLLPALNANSVDALYGEALDTLLRIQTQVRGDDIEAYSEARFTMELEYLPQWFLQRHLGAELGCTDWDVLELAFRRILTLLAEQPRVFVHRDFHSRNLMLTAQDSPGIIDFQGALYGPLTYDLVSLLRDCYIAWPPDRVEAWREDYRHRLVAAGLTTADAAQFRRWFDFTGLQRHIKVLGLFCRLCYRDGKPQYLADLPLVLNYVFEAAAPYAELADFIALLERSVAGVELTRRRDEAKP